MLKIEILVIGSIQTNTYIVYDENSKNAIIIDPASEAKGIINHIDSLGLNLKAIFITHGHYDHIGAVSELKAHYDIKVYTHEKEAEMMKDASRNLSLNFSGSPVEVLVDEYVNDGDVLEIDELKFTCIEVPGHSPTSICYYNNENNILFSGDTLFAGAIGRTDLFDGPGDTLLNKIKSKLLILPDETKVYPGHGNASTISYEKNNNPYLLM